MALFWSLFTGGSFLVDLLENQIVGFDENLTVALWYMWWCHNTRTFSLPTALVNVNMVANGKINTRLSPLAMARDGEVIQRQHFCHHGYTICHPSQVYETTKLHGTSTCGCSNNAIFSSRAIFTFPIVVVCRSRLSGSDKALTVHDKVQIRQHCWIHYFSCSRFPFCLSTVSNILIIILQSGAVGYNVIGVYRGYWLNVSWRLAGKSEPY